MATTDLVEKKIEAVQEKIDALRAKSEDSYVFACMAAVPLILTLDLLYQLWNNFKLYQYTFKPGKQYAVSHIAVSDLVLSGLCNEVGHELYEVEKNARSILLNDLVVILGEKRKNTIAAFLKDYASIEYKQSTRKNLKDLHLLIAQSFLNPGKMEEQIIERLKKANSDTEKIDLLLLHQNLLPLGFKSDLTDISNMVKNKSLSPILLAEDDPNAPGVLKIKLPEQLRGKVKNAKKKTDAENEIPASSHALQLIENCLKNKERYLDLGNCGLTDKDFEKGSPIEEQLKQCQHLEVLILSNEWKVWDYDKTDWINQKSNNTGNKNKLNTIPSAISSLSSLIELRCGGEQNNLWNINNLSAFNQLSNLRRLSLNCNQLENLEGLYSLVSLVELDLSNNKINTLSSLQSLNILEVLNVRYNQISSLSGLNELTLWEIDAGFNQIYELHDISQLYRLERLFLNNNEINSLGGIESLSNLNKVDLSNNKITDISALLDFISREHPVQLVVKETIEIIGRSEINLFGNPLTTPPIEMVLKGNEAILSYFNQLKQKQSKIDTKQDVNKQKDVSEYSFDKDVFISYAHLDDKPLDEGTLGWISDFHKLLEIRLEQTMGKSLNIWRDERLTGNDSFSPEIESQFAKSKIMIAIITPRYLNSKWCKEELYEFYKAAQETGGVAIESKSRIFKIVKTPFDSEALIELPDNVQSIFKETLDYKFYYQDSNNGKIKELSRGSNVDPQIQQSFMDKVDDVVHDIAKLLKRIDNPQKTEDPINDSQKTETHRKKIYLAETSSDLKEYRKDIKRDLEDAGYEVLPDGPIDFYENSYRREVETYINSCQLSIHLIGSKYGAIPEGSDKSIIEIQNEIAANQSASGKLKRLIWIPPLEKSIEDTRLITFIDQLKHKEEFSEGSDLLEGTIEEFKYTIFDTIKKLAVSDNEATNAKEKQNTAPQFEQVPNAEIEQDIKTIYLICIERDIEFITVIRKYLKSQGYAVLLSSFDGTPEELLKTHEENLKICDAAIIFYGTCPYGWFKAKRNDLIRLAYLGRHQPLLAKCIYLAEPADEDKETFEAPIGFEVINGIDGFNPDLFNNFIQKLKPNYNA